MEYGRSDQKEAPSPGAEQRRRPAPPGVEAAVAALSLRERIDLLTGVDNFTLPGQPSIGLRGMVVSDGPAGVRGPVLDPRDRSSSPPAPLALAAAWDPDLVEAVAAQIGREAKAKGVDVILGPTLNLARSPFGGRGFESFGEDPVLAAATAAAYVRGLQSAGVAATAKHFVGNDAEAERWTVDVRVDPATLREVYLAPFEACVTEADCAMIMAGYNLVNGTSMTEHGYLLDEVLKREWGFSGAVVSDWFAARSTEATANAGLDLVMPGPDGPWGARLAEAVARGTVSAEQVEDKLLRLLRVAVLVGALGGPAPTRVPGPHADRARLREAAARSFVLLRNAGGLLPLAGPPEPDRGSGSPGSPDASGSGSGGGADGPAPGPGLPASIALIGPNVTDPQYQGRGSAEVGSALAVGPEEGLRAALAAAGGASSAAAPVLRVAPGTRTWVSTPLPAPESLSVPDGVAPGTVLEVYDTDGALRYTGVRPVSEVTWWDPEPLVTGPGIGRIVLAGVYAASYTGVHRVAVGGIGPLRLRGVLVRGGGGRREPFEAGGTAPHPSDVMVSHAGPYEFAQDLELEDGDLVEFSAECVPNGYEHELVRFRVAIAPLPPQEQLLREAVAAARASEVAVVVVGSEATTESEGYDRRSLALPGLQDELIAAVAAVNPRTVVVVNSGMPMLMPWEEKVAAIVQAWFPGQEFGHALADVLLGHSEPGGRLPVTFPRSEDGLPVGRAEPVDGVLAYTEGVLVGYRGYERASVQPRYCFGHGLGYTSWSFEQLEVPFGPTRPGADVEVAVAVRNTGRRAGSLVVQAYLAGPGPAESIEPDRPLRVLAGFTRVHAEPGGTQIARIRLPHRAFARWDEKAGTWSHPRGHYRIEVGFSVQDLRLNAELSIG